MFEIFLATTIGTVKVQMMSWALFKRAWLAVGLFVLFGFDGQGAEGGPGKRSNVLDPDFERFVIEKLAFEKRLAEKYQITVRPIIWDFFDAAKRGDWQTTSNLFSKIEAGTYRYNADPWVHEKIWGPIHDTLGAYEQFHSWNPRLLHRFGDRIVTNIPPGSIYFGGTDVGRFVISALCQSHSQGRPFFTLTQNALADSRYVDYLREMYDAEIQLPTRQDSERAFAEYTSDAQKRLERNQLREGESVQMIGDRVQVNGVVAVMAINELLVKVILEKNPSREIYLEESYALDTLYARSVPHGLIFKVNHQALEKLPPEIIKRDHQFWRDECRALIGDAVQERTSVAELCSWVERVLVHPELAALTGDPVYFKDAQAPHYYSKCRSALATYYQWWSGKSTNAEADSLSSEADFAHRQAVALAPYNPFVVWRYADYLLQEHRTNDARVLVQTALRLNPEQRMEIDTDELKRALKLLRAEAGKFPPVTDKPARH